MTRQSELGAFLQAQRARLRPRDVGLVPDAVRRRVPGLRREEVARLARVSTDYYTRLEQGRKVSASESVLNAVARALIFDFSTVPAAERNYTRWVLLHPHARELFRD